MTSASINHPRRSHKKDWSGVWFWLCALVGMPLAVGAGLVVVYFMTLTEPPPPDNDEYPLIVRSK